MDNHRLMTTMSICVLITCSFCVSYPIAEPQTCKFRITRHSSIEFHGVVARILAIPAWYIAIRHFSLPWTCQPKTEAEYPMCPAAANRTPSSSSHDIRNSLLSCITRKPHASALICPLMVFPQQQYLLLPGPRIGSRALRNDCQGLSPAIPDYMPQSYLENSAATGFSICKAKTLTTHKLTDHALCCHRCRTQGNESTYTLGFSVLTASLHLPVLSVRL